MRPGIKHTTVKGQNRNITATAPTTLAMLINTERGIFDKKVLLTSFRQAQEYFGNYSASSYSMYALKILFDFYGIDKVWASRVKEAGNTDVATFAGADLVTSKLTVALNSWGADGNDFKMYIIKDTIQDDTVSVSVKAPVAGNTSDMVTFWEKSGLSTDPSSASFFASVMNDECDWTTFTITAPTKTEINSYIDGLTDGEVSFTGGTGTVMTPITTDYAGSSTNKTGVHIFTSEKTIRNLMIPDSVLIKNASAELSQATVYSDMIAWCNTTMSGRVIYIDTIDDNITTGNVKANVITSMSVDSDRACYYYNWTRISDPLTGLDTKYIPAHIHGFGSWVLTDKTPDSYGKAPANESLYGILGLRYEELEDGDLDVLSDLGVNPIIKQDGFRVMGAWMRTNDSEWKYIHVVRTYVIHWTAIVDNSKPYVYLVKDQSLVGKLNRDITNYFMKYDRRLVPTGNLYNRQDNSAVPYYVNVSLSETGKVIINWGISVVDTAEMIEYLTSLWDGGSETVRVAA